MLRRIVVLALVLGSIASASPAPAEGPAYTYAGTRRALYPEVFSRASSDAHATADRLTGAVTASATAQTTASGGFLIRAYVDGLAGELGGFGYDASKGTAEAWVSRQYPVESGTYEFAVHFTGVEGSVVRNGGGPSDPGRLTGATTGARVRSSAVFFSCATPTVCFPEAFDPYESGTFSDESTSFECGAGCTIPEELTHTLTVTVPSPERGYVTVWAGVLAEASASDPGSTSSSARATVAEITLTD